jgi:hypothetical protein
MAQTVYQDFDLLFERSGEDKYRARVLVSPGGQANGEFSLPFSKLELENFLLKIGRPRRGVRSLESAEMDAIRDFGGKLFTTVFSGDILVCLRTSLEKASGQEGGLRIRLRLTDAPELADLPWEFLSNPALNRFLSLSERTPIVRYLELPEPVRPMAVRSPLRLLVIISSPKDYPALDVTHEWENLQTALAEPVQRGLLTIEKLETATLTALAERLEQNDYHILHFIGHGGFDESTQEGVLVMEDENGNSSLTNGQSLGTMLFDESSMRLAVLNACEGARASRSDPFSGVAQSLVQQGIPAVIAMQFEVSDQAAMTFSKEFYSGVADGMYIDTALAQARKAIFAQKNDIE